MFCKHKSIGSLPISSKNMHMKIYLNRSRRYNIKRNKIIYNNLPTFRAGKSICSMGATKYKQIIESIDKSKYQEIKVKNYKQDFNILIITRNKEIYLKK